MENILHTDAAASLVGWVEDGGEEIRAINEDGGVGVWDVPPTIAPAFNPLIFRRRNYYIQDGEYQPTISPLFIGVSSTATGFTLLSAATSDIYIRYMDEAGDEYTVMIAVGTTNVEAQEGERIDIVQGVALTAAGPFNGWAKDSEHYYIAPTQENYEEWEQVDDGYLFTTPEGYVMYGNSDVVGGSLTISNPLSGKQATISGASYNGALTLDISPIVRAWLADKLREVSNNDVIVDDSALYVRYFVDIFSNMPFMAINAVVQIGESTNMVPKVGNVLTTKPMLSYYKDYPLDYSILSGAEGVVTPNGTTIPYSISRIFVKQGLLMLLLAEDGTPILTEDGEYIYLYGGNGTVMNDGPIRIVERCVPPAPFYVRWINTEGGVDYWMFQFMQERSMGVSNVERARIYVPNPAEASSNERVVAFNTKNTIRVGATGLKKGDFDALRKLPFSPLVEWWNEATQKWVGLTIDNYELNYSTRQPLHDVEMTFALPALYTQQSIWQ